MAKMSLTDALDRMNVLSLKNRTEKLSLEELAEFESLSAALEQFELPSAGKKTTPGLYNPTNKVNFQGTGQSFKTPNGQTIRAYKKDDPFCTDVKLEDQEVGEMIRALITGADHRPSGFQKISNSHGSDSPGIQYVTPTIVSQRLYDLARARSVTQKSGCQTIPLTNGNMTFIKTLAPDITPTWHEKWHDVNITNPSFTTANLSAKTCTAIAAISLEQVEDASNSARYLEQILSAAIANAIDSAILTGAGGSTIPLGITKTPGINEQTSVGFLSDYSEHLDAIIDILNANFDGEVSDLVWLTSPKVAGALAKLTDGDDNPLVMPDWLKSMRCLMTTNLVELSDSPDTYYSIVGSFRDVILGVRSSGLQVELLRTGSAVDGGGNTFNALTGLGMFIRCYMRMDCCCLYPAHLNVLSGIVA